MSHHGGAAPSDPAWWVVLLLLAALGVPYLRAAAVVGRRAGRGWPRTRTTAWVGGALLAALAVSPAVGAAVGGAVGGAAGGGARAHMAQHVLLGMAAPLGLVLGAPVTLALAALPVARRRRAASVLRARAVRTLTHPVVAASLHVGGLYALYLTPLYRLTTEHPWVHGLVLVHFLLAGSLFVWAVAGPEAVSRAPGVRTRLAVLVVAAGAHGYLAKLVYARAPLLPPGGTHAVADLRDAAQWMYYAGDVAEVALAVLLLHAWYRRRGRLPARERHGRAGAGRGRGGAGGGPPGPAAPGEGPRA